MEVNMQQQQQQQQQLLLAGGINSYFKMALLLQEWYVKLV
jgi:hypothetical protein